MQKPCQYRLPQWPTQNSWAQVGLVESASTCSTRLQLRAPDWFDGSYLSIRFQVFEDRRFAIEAEVFDLYSAGVREMETLLKALKSLQKAVEKAKDDLGSGGYVTESDLAWFLTCLFKRINATEVVEYRPGGGTDLIRTVIKDDARRIADQLSKLTAFRS